MEPFITITLTRAEAKILVLGLAAGTVYRHTDNVQLYLHNEIEELLRRIEGIVENADKKRDDDFKEGKYHEKF